MKINIQFINIPKDEAVSGKIRNKLQSLGEKYDWVIRANVFLKDINNDRPSGKVCEIQLSLPGPRIFATASEANIETTISKAIGAAEKQLKQRKNELYKKRN